MRPSFVWECEFSIEVSLDFQQFGIEHGSTRGAANGVVGEHSEFPVQHRAWTKPAHCRRHSSTAIGVESWLWPISRFHIPDRLFRSAGQLQFLRSTPKFIPRADNFLRLHFLFQLHRNRFCVSI